MKNKLAIIFIFFFKFIFSQEIIKIQNGEFDFYATKKLKNQFEAKITQIDIFKNGLKIQSITPSKNSFFDNEDIITVEDMNFDKHKDFRLVQSSMEDENGGFPYLYWIYNPSNGLFEINLNYEKITSPVFNYNTKEIISTTHGYLRQKTIYKYKLRNKNPVIFEKYTEEYVKNEGIKAKHWKLVNKELKLIETKFLKKNYW